MKATLGFGRLVAPQLCALPRITSASPSRLLIGTVSSPAMGQALSSLPLPGRRGAASSTPTKAKAGKVAMERPADEDPDLWMICGLGNPGPRYEDTRHNVGFMAVDALARQEAIAVDRLQENAAVGRGRFSGKKVLLVKPMTFMNVSGEAVGRLARFYRIPPERILVVYDDLDLPTAAVRLRAKGGHGGHNGMKSISAHLQGSKDFPRVRIGIGRPPGSMAVPTYVLQDFGKAEREQIDIAVQETIDIIRSVLTVGMEKAVSGVRVDRDGKPIPPPHSNGKGGGGKSGGGKEGQQPAAKKHRKAAEGGDNTGASGGGSASAAASQLQQQLRQRLQQQEQGQKEEPQQQEQQPAEALASPEAQQQPVVAAAASSGAAQ